jgi:hypothetical protein
MKFDIDFDLSLLKIDELEGALKGEAFLSSNEEGGSSRAFCVEG